MIDAMQELAKATIGLVYPPTGCDFSAGRSNHRPVTKKSLEEFFDTLPVDAQWTNLYSVIRANLEDVEVYLIGYPGSRVIVMGKAKDGKWVWLET